MKTEKVYKRPANVRKSIWNNASWQTRDIMFYAGMGERFKKQLREVKSESESDEQARYRDREARMFNDTLFGNTL